MVERARITKETRSLLTVESTITDALCIIAAVIAIQLISSNSTPEITVMLNMLLSSFSIAILFGMVSAAIWIFFPWDILTAGEYSVISAIALITTFAVPPILGHFIKPNQEISPV